MAPPTINEIPSVEENLLSILTNVRRKNMIKSDKIIKAFFQDLSKVYKINSLAQLVKEIVSVF